MGLLSPFTEVRTQGILKTRKLNSGTRREAFTLVEALVAILISGMMFTALYAGMAYGFRIIKLARENTRATQIMLEHMEICRLYKWRDLTNTSSFLLTNSFIVPYYGVGGTNTSLVYTGRVRLDPVYLGTTYQDDMRKLTIQLNWAPDRSRTMTTYVTRNGLQNYVW